MIICSTLATINKSNMDNNKLSEHLQFLIKNKHITAEKLIQILGISKDSFYRRLRGEMDFLLNEAFVLQRILKFSLDGFNGGSDSRIFTIKNFPTLTTPQATVAQYVSELHQDLQKVYSMQLQQLYYAAKDLPLFCFFSSPALTSFKLYFWYITIFDADAKLEKYNGTWLHTSILKEAQQVYELYESCDSTEIWNFETINSTLHQIRYCKDAGLIAQKDAVQIFNALKEFVHKLEANCKAGTKNGAGKLTMYLNEILLLDNSVIFDTKAVKIFYLPFQTLNFLSNTDADFTQNNLQWFNKQIAKSTIITGNSQKDRNRLITHYLDEIEGYE
jgi:hypothetical protein